MAVSQVDVKRVGAEAERQSEPFRRLTERMHEVIVGQDHLLRQMMIALLTRGHLLIEGVPGLAKTLAVSCLARGIATTFQRVQFTPDLLPADLIGTQVYRQHDGQFVVQKGPIFTHILLADEINRAPAKVQSALLQAMQERQVTIGKETFTLEEPFLVLATQNPIEQEGTYPLPEAQVDRFLMKVIVTYPTRQQERLILDRMATTAAVEVIDPVMSPSDMLSAREVVNELYMDDKIKDYVVDIVTATRNPAAVGLDIAHWIQYGASPRTTIALALSAKAGAFLSGRGFVTPQDVKSVAMDVLRHRVILTYEAEAEEKTAQDTVQLILDHVPVP